MKRSKFLLVGLALVATAAFAGDGNIHRNPRHIPGRYIVVLASGADSASVASSVHGRVHHEYKRALKALSIETTDADAQALARDSRVQYVEEDATISASTTPWGLDRIDQRSLPLNGSYVSTETGVGVTVYVVDTGISHHSDFGGRVLGGFNALEDNNGADDCNGHGTHVAGIIGGTNYGVAPAVTLVPVRVLDCNGAGTLSSVIAGLDWVMQDHAASPGPAVVNMSLGGDPSTALDSEVVSVITAGMTVVVAAGNNNVDACTKSPSRVLGALTVGASNENDQKASFSNFGSCVDLFAPGTNIVSDWFTSGTATSVSSGTSESAPFVTGVAALTLERYPSASTLTVSQTILQQTTQDTLSNIGAGSPNRLLFSSIDSIADTTGDSQLLADPSFDYGTTFWTADICTVVNPTGCPPDGEEFLMNAPSHSGHTHATIGGKQTSFHLMSEIVTIPATVSRAQLSAFLWIVTKGNKKTADDTLTVEIRDANGALLATVGAYSNLDANATYTQQTFDVTRFKGQRIRIAFTGVQKNGPPTWFMLDDVALNVWR